MAVYVVNLTIDQGTDFSQVFNLESSTSNNAVNLSDYTGSAQLRKHASSKKYYDFTVSFPDRGAGQVKIAMTDVITSRIKAGRYVYDLILTDSTGTKERAVEGTVLVRESATKE